MTTLFNSISSVLVIFLLTAVGYLMGIRGWMSAEHKSFVSKFITNIGLPCMCFNNLVTTLSKDLLAHSLLQLLVPLLGMPLLFLLSLAAARLLRLPRRQVGPFVVMSSLSNAIFVGYAMCSELFGPACAPTVMLFYLVNTTLSQSVGVGFLEYSGNPEGTPFSLHDVAGIFKRPLIWSVVLGMLVVYSQLSMPSVLMSTTKYLGGTVSSMGLLFTGFIIYEIGLKNLRLTRGLPTMLCLRFLVSPLLALALCAAFGITGLPRDVIAVEMAMPCITQVVVLSAAMGADERYAAQGAAISTLLCFIVIPVLMLLL